MSAVSEVTQKDLQDLLDIFQKEPFDACLYEEGTLVCEITDKCEALFKLDYTVFELDNSNGILSPRYPVRIFIPECEHNGMAVTLTPQSSSAYSQAPTISASTISQNSIINKNFRLYKGAASAASTSSTTIMSSPSSSSTKSTTSPSTNVPDNSADTQNLFQQAQYPYRQQGWRTAKIMSPVSPSAPAANTMTANTNTSTSASSTIYENQYDANKIRELIPLAKYARCRQRFVVPAIMYRGNYICRSATISRNFETIGRKVVAYYIGGEVPATSSNAGVDAENNDSTDEQVTAQQQQMQFSHEENIKSDIQLLEALNVSTIVDLMVEMRKTKYFVYVSSSEKADPDNHYQNFNLLSLPYPGCEFFKNFRDNNYIADNLKYDWLDKANDAVISVPYTGTIKELDINWLDYKNWDLVLMTQNYLKACLKYIQEGKSGILIHCISGWDRTPLFISLIRLSLWADGLIHQSLSPLQITYLTLAYDWFLFGHQLTDRLKKGEDIMYFCFYMLKNIGGSEFSIGGDHNSRRRTKTTSSNGSSVIVLSREGGEDDMKEEEMSFCGDSNESMDNLDRSTSSDNISLENDRCFTPASQIIINNPLTNRSPSAKRVRTSPISVPGAKETPSQRQDSISSAGSSWQYVNEAGSVDSLMNSTNSNNVKDEITLVRAKRLNSVRALFMKIYGRVVGLKFKEGD